MSKGRVLVTKNDGSIMGLNKHNLVSVLIENY